MKDDRKKHSGHKHKLAPNGPPISPPEIIPDSLVVPDETILLVPDHNAFNNPPHFVKATQHRSWFSPYFYHCLPIVMGNQHGFLMLSTYDFVIRWNGSDGVDGVDIHYLEPVTHPAFVTVESHFGHGILTVQSRYVFRTPKGVNLMVKEPPNYPVDGLTWMNAVVETDNLRRDFTFNIKITRPHLDIFIPRGTPIGCLLPYPRYFLDGYSMAELTDSLELDKAQRTINYFAEERDKFDDSPRHRYMEGIDVFNIEFEHHQKTLDNGNWWFSTRKRPEKVRTKAEAENGNGGGLMSSFKDMLKGFFSNPPTEGGPENHSPSGHSVPANLGEAQPEPTVLKCPVTQATRESMVATGAPIKHDSTSTPAHSGIPAPNGTLEPSGTVAHSETTAPTGQKILGEKEIYELNADLPESTITLFLPPHYDKSLVPVKASMSRRWLEEDRKTTNHGRFCLPLSMGSGVGWYILSPATFTVKWDGDITHDATVEIHEKSSHAEIDCHSACGSFTVQVVFTPRTKRPGDYVFIKGISNQFRKPYQFLEAMLEAWWSPASFGLVGILNQACEFTIKKGEPLAQMFAIHMDQASYGLELREAYAPHWKEWDEKRRDPSYTGRNMDYLKGLLPDETAVCPHFNSFPITSTALASTKIVEAELPQPVEGEATDGPKHGKYANKALPEKKVTTNQSVTDLVRDTRVAVGNKNSEEAERLLALARAKSEEENLISFELVAAYQDIAHLYMSSADYKKAASKLNEAMQLYHRLSAVDHEHLARLFQDLGYAERMEENYDDAEKHLKTAIEIAIGTKLSDVAVASAKFDLGSLYTKLLRFDESEPLLKEAIELRTKALGEKHPDTLFAVNGLACLIAQQGKFDEAEELFRKMIKLREEVLGKDSLDVADSYNDLGFLYRDTEHYDKSVEAYIKATELRKAKLGADHLDVAEFVMNTAFAYLMANDFKNAKKYFEEDLAIKEKRLPSHDPIVLRSIENLAHVHSKLGEDYEAEELLKRVNARR